MMGNAQCTGSHSIDVDYVLCFTRTTLYVRTISRGSRFDVHLSFPLFLTDLGGSGMTESQKVLLLVA